MGTGPRILIGTSEQTRSQAQAIAQRLRAAGYQPDIATVAAQSDQTLDQAIARAAACVILVSPQDATAKAIEHLVNRADSHQCPLIPVQLEDGALPAALGTRTPIDLRGDLNLQLPQLTQAVRAAVTRTHPAQPAWYQLFAQRSPRLVTPYIERNFTLDRDQHAVIADAMHYLRVAGFKAAPLTGDSKSKHKRQKGKGTDPIHLVRGTLSYNKLFAMPSPRYIATDIWFETESFVESRTNVSITYAVAEMPQLHVLNSSIKFWNAEVDELVHAIKRGTLNRTTSRHLERRATLISLVLNFVFFAIPIVLAMVPISMMLAYLANYWLAVGIGLLLTVLCLLPLFMVGFLRVILVLGLRR